jgi:hypothetical protein
MATPSQERLTCVNGRRWKLIKWKIGHQTWTNAFDKTSSFFKPYNCGDPVTLESDAVRAPILPGLQIPHHQPPPDADNVSLDEHDAQQPTPPDGDNFHGFLEAEVQNPAPHENEPLDADNFPPITSDEEEDELQNPGAPERRGSRQEDAQFLFTM